MTTGGLIDGLRGQLTDESSNSCDHYPRCPTSEGIGELACLLHLTQKTIKSYLIVSSATAFTGRKDVEWVLV